MYGKYDYNALTKVINGHAQFAVDWMNFSLYTCVRLILTTVIDLLAQGTLWSQDYDLDRTGRTLSVGAKT